jgi:hypothetical protein
MRKEASLLFHRKAAFFGPDRRSAPRAAAGGGAWNSSGGCLLPLNFNLHEVLQTVFPKPLPEINAEVFEEGNWEGELLQRWRNSDYLQPIGAGKRRDLILCDLSIAHF